MFVLHHVVLALCVAALAGAGLRLASRLGAKGLQRVVVAAVLAAATGCAEILALSLFGLGGSTVLIAALAFATWLAARRLVPIEGALPREELLAWWGSAALAERIVLGAAVGAWLVWAAWLTRYPVLGSDSMIYHVPEVIEWVHNGRPGSISGLFPGYPVGSYPVTNEVLTTWATAISRSFVPVILWAPAMIALLVAAGWTGLRSLGVARLASGLAVAVLALTPAIGHWQKNGAHTDLPSITWLVCCAALVASAGRRTVMLAPALIAGALAVGTKTTTLPLVLVTLGAGAWVHRRRLRAAARPLAVGAVLAFVVGGIWYARNLVLHGSPLWPFVAAPWGDPPPEVIAPSGEVVEQVYTKFLETPVETTKFVFSNWADPFLGGVLLTLSALAAPILAPRRSVMLAAGFTALSLLLWMNAPFTGISPGDAGSGALTTMRYLLPTFAAGATTLALASRDRPRGFTYAVVTFAVALAATVWQLIGLGYPAVPTAPTLLAGCLIGAAAFWLAGLGTPSPRMGQVLEVGTVPAVILLGVVASLGGYNFIDRHAAAAGKTSALSAGPQLIGWLKTQPGYHDNTRPVAQNVVLNAALAGNSVQHPVVLIDARETCARQRERVGEGWVVINRSWPTKHCLAGYPVRFRRGEYVVYGG